MPLSEIFSSGPDPVPILRSLQCSALMSAVLRVLAEPDPDVRFTFKRKIGRSGWHEPGAILGVRTS